MAKVFFLWLFAMMMTVALEAAEDLDFLKNVPAPPATVGPRPITKKRLAEEMLAKNKAEHYRRLTPEALEAEIRKYLDILIAKTVMEKIFTANNITATPDEVSSRLRNIYQQMTPKQRQLLQNKLFSKKQTFRDYTSQASNDPETLFALRLRKLIELKFPGQMTFDDNACEEYYRNNQTGFLTPESVDLSRIFIDAKKSPTATQEQLWKAEQVALWKAEQVYAELKKGATFESMAAKFSDCPSKNNNGHIGLFIRHGGLEPGEDQVAFELPEGSISEIVKITTGYEILKVNRHTPEGYSTIEEVKPFILEQLQNDRINRLSTKLLNREKRSTRITINYPPSPTGSEVAP